MGSGQTHNPACPAGPQQGMVSAGQATARGTASRLPRRGHFFKLLTLSFHTAQRSQVAPGSQQHWNGGPGPCGDGGLGFCTPQDLAVTDVQFLSSAHTLPSGGTMTACTLASQELWLHSPGEASSRHSTTTAQVWAAASWFQRAEGTRAQTPARGLRHCTSHPPGIRCIHPCR